MSQFTESDVEDAALEWLSGLGYTVLHGPDISPDSPAPEREAYSDVVLMGRLEQAVDLTPEIIAFCLKQIESYSEHIRNNVSKSCTLTQTRNLLLPKLVSAELQTNNLFKLTEAAK